MKSQNNTQQNRQPNEQRNVKPQEYQNPQNPFVSGIIELLNIVGHFLISNTFVRFVSRIFTSHIEVLNYVIKNIFSKEFYIITIKYSVILTIVFSIKSVILGTQISAISLLLLSGVSLINIKRYEGQVEIKFLIKDEVKGSIKEEENYIQDTPEKIEQSSKEDDLTIPSKMVKKFYIEDKEPEKIEKIKQEGVTEESIDFIRDLFTESRKETQEKIFTGNPEIFERAMNPMIASEFDIEMEEGDELANDLLMKLTGMKEGASKLGMVN